MMGGGTVVRGRRIGQFRYYLRATARAPWGQKWNRFWSARWFWSCGRIGSIPVGYSSDYWSLEDPPEDLAERFRWVFVLWLHAVLLGMGIGCLIMGMLLAVASWLA